MSEPAPAVAPPAGHPEVEWRRLPPKMLVVAPATILLKFLPAFVIVLLFGGSESPNIWCRNVEVRSTVRIRSRGTERRWRLTSPLCSSTRSGVIR